MSIDDKKIMDLLNERGMLRFSTLMLRFHISSMEAISIVDEYKKKGIIDDKGKAASGVKTAWKNPYAEDNMETGPKENMKKKQSGKAQENSESTQQEVQEKAPRKKKEAESAVQNISKSKGRKNSKRVEAKPVQPQSSNELLVAENSSKKPSKRKTEHKANSKINQEIPSSNPVQMSFLEETESPKPRRKAASKTAMRKPTIKKNDIAGQMSLF